MKPRLKSPRKKRTAGPTGAGSTRPSAEAALLAPPRAIVGIGASAGGLEAFRQLLEHLPADTGMAFVYVQHLSPTHASMLSEVLAGATTMPVSEVTEGTRVEADHVYVIPPNRSMIVEQGVLRLSTREEGRKPPMPVDIFFRSLAEDQRDNAVGVVLSGTASDATRGLLAIKAEGGVAFAQEPATARYDGMPRSAIAAGTVDFVLPPDRIAAELAALARHPRLIGQQAHGGDEASPQGFQRVLSLLGSIDGIDFHHYKHTTIRRRIARRMAVQRIADLDAYEGRLREDRRELAALHEDLLIHVTDFFRDGGAFAALKQRVLPMLTDHRPARSPIRVWVPGCSTGEEVYSIAMVLLEHLAETRRDFPIQIFGTDASEQAVEKARVGVYSAAAVSDVAEERRRRFFVAVDQGFRINKSVRDLCVFVKHDLTRDAPFSKLDLVSCRNVLIYFDASLQKKVIPLFHYALKHPGFLMLGHAETMPSLGAFFTEVDGPHRIYARSPGPSHAVLPLSRALHRGALAPASSPGAIQPVGLDVAKEADHILLLKYAPPAVIVDEHLDILQFRGRTAPFLEPAPGQASLNLLRMARPGLLPDLQRAIEDARQGNASVRREGIQFRRDGEVARADVEVTPIKSAALNRARCYLVTFRDPAGQAAAKPPARAKSARGGKSAEKEIVTQLRSELDMTREYLGAVVADHEKASSELTAANEELLSSNEELQSTNEELQTAKEELQSTNEELHTLNDELQNRNANLDQLNNDLVNLLSGVEIPILILDANLRIRRFTPRAREIMNVIQSDLGRPIGDIRPNVDVPDLERQIREVIERIDVRSMEVRDRQGRWYRMQIRPYKTMDQKIDGALITLVDVDAAKRATVLAEAARDYAAMLVELAPTPLAILDRELRVRSTNRAFHETFAAARDEVKDAPLGRLIAGGELPGDLRRLLAGAFGDGAPLRDVEVSLDTPRTGTKALLVSGQAIPSADEGPGLIIVAFEDVTERARVAALEQEARAAELANHQKDVFLAMLSHELRTPLNTILIWAQQLRKGTPTPEKLERALHAIERNARLQAQLVSDLLDVSRISADKMIVTFQEIDPRQAIEAAVESARLEADARSVKLAVELAPEAGLIRADPSRLQQVVWNLVSNAIKFTPDGGRVEVRLERDGDDVHIHVSDTGAGIDAEFLPRVFEPFAQADSSPTRAHRGLGLGLAITRHLVSRHGGTITAASDGPGKGATFQVTLPVRGPADEMGAPPPAEPA